MQLSRTKKTTLIFIVIVSALAFIINQLNNYAVDSSLPQWKEGLPGYISSMRAQKESNKPVVLFFYTDWCASCKKLREEILSSPEVEQYMGKLLPVKINPENGALENQLSEEYGVIGYPTVIIIPGENKPYKTVVRTSNVTPTQFIAQCENAMSDNLQSL